MSSKKRDNGECNCKKARGKSSKQSSKKSPKGTFNRKRQTLVFNPEEETYVEPYLHYLREEFSKTTLVCDSKIELPWKEIRLNSEEIKIRKDIAAKSRPTSLKTEIDVEPEQEENETNTTMSLPWKMLVISGVKQPQNVSTLGLGQCDSKLEIPWDILVFDSPVKINPAPEEESCIEEGVEIPWNDLMIPQNLVIEAKKIIEHPSNKHPPRSATSGKRRGCSPCIRTRKELKKQLK